MLVCESVRQYAFVCQYASMRVFQYAKVRVRQYSNVYLCQSAGFGQREAT